MQVGFGYAFARQEWTDEEFGLKRFQGTGRLSLLLVNSMDGLQEMLQSPIPELFSVCTKRTAYIKCTTPVCDSVNVNFGLLFCVSGPAPFKG